MREVQASLVVFMPCWQDARRRGLRLLNHLSLKT